MYEFSCTNYLNSSIHCGNIKVSQIHLPLSFLDVKEKVQGRIHSSGSAELEKYLTFPTNIHLSVPWFITVSNPGSVFTSAPTFPRGSSLWCVRGRCMGSFSTWEIVRADKATCRVIHKSQAKQQHDRKRSSRIWMMLNVVKVWCGFKPSLVVLLSRLEARCVTVLTVICQRL